MSGARRLAAAMLLAALLCGCAYRPLKAPCSADEGGAVTAYSSLDVSQAAPNRPRDACGPMRPI